VRANQPDSASPLALSGSVCGPADGPARAAWPVDRGRTYRWLARLAVALIITSVGLLTAVAVLGPSVAEPAMGAASGGWPPYFVRAHPPGYVVTIALWLALVTGGAGVSAGLLGVRRGWRPDPRHLIIAAVAGVLVLVLVPPIGSTDMLDYAAYGRIAALGRNPYEMTPAQLRRTGDPVGLAAPVPWEHTVSVYGPLATATQELASLLGGDSAARTVWWLKVGDALAFLAVALALDWFGRPDRARRARAHLLWSANPVMLLAVIAGGHQDALGAAFGVLAVLSFRRPGWRDGLIAGGLTGLAICVKAPFALFGLGLAVSAVRSPRALAGLSIGAAATVLPGYAEVGFSAIKPTLAVATRGPNLYQPLQLVARAVPWLWYHDRLDVLALAASALFAAVLLWGLPDGPPDLPAVRPALAFTLAWLLWSPQQRPWFDAMLFPLLVLMPASRLDWFAELRGATAAAAELPGVLFYRFLRPHWLPLTAGIISRGIVPVTIMVAAIALALLCVTRRMAGPDPPQRQRAASAARRRSSVHSSPT
jgi:hypothetical protein